MPTPQGRYWCWTLNNPTAEEQDQLTITRSTLPNQQIQYLIYQKEVGDSGTIHLQGYLELSTRKTLNQTKKILDLQRVHLELRKGTAEQARTYCMKEDGRLDGPFEGGDCSAHKPSSSGTRTDIAAVRERIKDGATELEIADEFFTLWCQFNSSFRRYRTLCFSDRNWKSKVIVCVGPPRTGKSKYAMENYPGAYWKQRSQWWDNYEGHETVILDDFYGWLPYDTLLRMCDRYPCLLESKGGQIKFLAKTILFTSNHTPAQWYKNFNIEAFAERVEEWRYYNKDGTVLVTNSYASFCNGVDRQFITHDE